MDLMLVLTAHMDEYSWLHHACPHLTMAVDPLDQNVTAIQMYCSQSIRNDDVDSQLPVAGLFSEVSHAFGSVITKGCTSTR